MSSQFKTIALFGRPRTEGLDAILASVERWLTRRGVKVLVQHNQDKRTILALGRRADLGIIVGGDGTMLGVARTLAPLGLPVVGINLGRLGFITDIPFELEDRALLDVTAHRRTQSLFHSLALNDVTLSRSSRAGMIEVEVKVDGVFMYSERADGIILATPTGSTAYSLSASGPILHPMLQGLVLVPVAPQALSNRPIVLPDHAVIELHVIDGRNPRVNCDMQNFAELQRDDVVVVRRSAHSSRFLHPPGYSYYATLRSKLNWHEMPHLKPRR